jgi:uncharacterized protein DUF4157
LLVRQEGRQEGWLQAALHKVVNRSATPRPVPAAVPMRPVPTGTVQLQSTMRVSSPRDPAEKEADTTARKVLRMAAPRVAGTPGDGSGGQGDVPLRRELESPYIARFAHSIRLMRQHAAAPMLARRGEGSPAAGANLASDIAGSQGAGAPLPTGVRTFMEPRFGADFSKVRVHTGEPAARLNRQVSAQAFTVGNQIFFGKDQFQPDTPQGQELIAHELTHTLQQGAAVQHGASVQHPEDVTVAQQSSPHVQRLGMGDVLGFFADKASALPGFRMLTLVLGVNPLDMRRVDRSAANILRATVEFLPGGVLITRALDTYRVFARVAGWVERQFGTLGLSGKTLRGAINRFIDSLGVRDVFNPGGVWARAKRIITDPIDRLLRFARGLSGEIMDFLKDAILRPIASLASRMPGWGLLCAVLGKNPVTGAAVPRSAETVIGGFMRLIRQGDIWENIQRGKAVSRAWSWFQGALSGLLGFVRQLPGNFMKAVRALGLKDLVFLPRAFARVAGVFGGFLGRFRSWAGNTVWNLLEIIFSVVAPGVMVYLRRAAGAFRTILQNPVRFVGNLVRAAGLGFRQFAARFLTHLRRSLIGWLTGTLKGTNIHIPSALNQREIIKFVLSVLKLTWQNIRQRLVRVIGEPATRALETGFELVRKLVTQGPAAAWEKLQEGLSNLREMVMEQIMTFVQDRVVRAAVTRLVSMLSPAGAFIQAIIATYNTVRFFVERLREISQVATSFLNSIAAIAAGNLASAANRVEQTMGGMLTLVISFLARIAGLGKVSSAVTNVVNRVRQPMDRALERVVAWLVAQARRLRQLVVGGTRSVARRITQWWRVRAVFQAASGNQHSLFFRGEGPNATLSMASESSPRSLKDVLEDNDLVITEREALKARLENINAEIAANENMGEKPEKEQKDFQDKIAEKVQALADELHLHLRHEGGLPASVITFGSNAGRASFVMGMPLTKNPGNTTGSPTRGRLDTVGDKFVTAFVSKTPYKRTKPNNPNGDTIMVSMLPLDQVHLLHEKLHGPFSKENIALGDKTLNKGILKAEAAAIKEIGSGQIRYRVDLAYHSDAPPPEDPIEIPEPVVPTIRGWVGFYIARQATVSISRWVDNAYSAPFFSITARGEIPAVRDEKRESIDDLCFRVARENLDSSLRKVREREVEYTPTTLNREDLEKKIKRTSKQMKEALSKLDSSRRILVLDNRIYVRE